MELVVQINPSSDFNGLMSIYGAAVMFNQTVGHSVAISDLITKLENIFLTQISVSQLNEIKTQISNSYSAMQSNGMLDAANEISANNELKLNLG